MRFFFKKRRVLGFDLSKYSVKVVELEHQVGGFRLITYGGLELPLKGVGLNTPEGQNKMVATINEVLERAKTSTRNIVASLSPQHVFNSILWVPKVPDKELAEAIRWEAKQYIPAPLEDVIIDWQKIEEDTARRRLKIYLVAAPKNLINKYLKLYEVANLKPLALEIDPLALIRCFSSSETPENFVIVDIGAYETNISVVEKNVLRLCRTLTSGSEVITKAIATNLGVTEERALQFKKDFGLKPDKLEGQLLKSIQPIINSIVTEVKRSLEFYKKEASGPVKEIILAGGGAQLPGLAEHLSQKLDLPAKIGDPWARIDYPSALEPKLKEIGPSFAVAVGLAMRSVV